MAASTITQRIALEGADQIKQALAQIGKSGQEAFQQIQQAGAIAFRATADRATTLADAMKFADHSEVELERLKAERAAERKRTEQR
jgi:soluble P-type ATPase